jgi:hypothetical protein
VVFRLSLSSMPRDSVHLLGCMHVFCRAGECVSVSWMWWGWVRDSSGAYLHTSGWLLPGAHLHTSGWLLPGEKGLYTGERGGGCGCRVPSAFVR